MLTNKVAIVTGASSGIGKAVSIALGAAGVKVALAARRLDKLLEVEKTINSNGGTAISIQTDVTDRQQVKDMVKVSEEKLGPVDILVNNAGTWFITWMKNCMEDHWDTMIDLNIKGVTNCIGAVLDGMVKRGQGHIVNMSSDAGRKPFPGFAVYCGTKYYVEGLSQTMRLELKGTGVKVTCIQPGDVSLDDSPYDHLPDKEAAGVDISDTFKTLEPIDIANAVMYALNQPAHVAVNEVLIQPRENSFAVYCGTKYYVEGLSQTMRLELKGTGVKVTCIQPGDVSLDDSPYDHLPDKEAAGVDISDTFKTLEPIDIANAVMYALNQPAHVAVNEVLIQPRENSV